MILRDSADWQVAGFGNFSSRPKPLEEITMCSLAQQMM
jgi:hypothetical protein